MNGSDTLVLFFLGPLCLSCLSVRLLRLLLAAKYLRRIGRYSELPSAGSRVLSRPGELSLAPPPTIDEHKDLKDGRTNLE